MKTLQNSLKYYELFDKNVYKIIDKNNKLILGHTHHYSIDKYYINTGTFLDKNMYILKDEYNEYCIISDLHIGGTLWNYKKDELRPLLIKLILKYKNKLILNGDIFELWLENPKKLIREYSDILNLIEDSKCIYIKGNHDYDIDKYFKLKTYKSYKINDWTIKHGWEYDPMNNNIFIQLYYLFMIHFGDNVWWLQKKLLPYRQKLVNFFWKRKN